MKSRKSQVWYTDFMVGFLIFVIAVFMYYTYAHNIDEDPRDYISELMLESKAITSYFLTAGSPADWNQSNVKIIGLTDGNQRINQNKLEMFANMTYSESRSKLRTPYDYYFYLEDVNGSKIPIEGNQGIGLQGNNSRHLVSMTRVVVYDSRITSMVVHVWD